MSYEIPGFKLGVLKASADLSAKQYRFLKVTGAGTVGTQSTLGKDCIGVLQNKPASGETAEIDCDGVTKVIAGAAIDPSVEARVMSDANGAAITAATAGSTVQGHALEAATAAGQLIAVKLTKSVF